MIQGDDHPGRTSVFQSRFVSALKWTGGFASSGAIPDAFGPLYWSQCMDSNWNLYRPFDKLSQELRLASKTMHEASAIKEVMEEEKRWYCRDGNFLFMINSLRGKTIKKTYNSSIWFRIITLSPTNQPRQKLINIFWIVHKGWWDKAWAYQLNPLRSWTILPYLDDLHQEAANHHLRIIVANPAQKMAVFNDSNRILVLCTIQFNRTTSTGVNWATNPRIGKHSLNS